MGPGVEHRLEVSEGCPGAEEAQETGILAPVLLLTCCVSRGKTPLSEPRFHICIKGRWTSQEAPKVGKRKALVQERRPKPN